MGEQGFAGHLRPVLHDLPIPVHRRQSHAAGMLCYTVMGCGLGFRRKAFMSETFKPENAEQVEEAVRWALAKETSLEVIGSASKQAYGRPSRAEHKLDLSQFSGIVNYEPEELVMSASPGTPMAEIEQALEPHRQQLAFEPADLGGLLGASSGTNASGTIGGVFACNLSGPRRLKIGAARDHILGFQGVSGRGESFKSGGRMFKNVTGFDLSKLMTGSFGTLAVLTELTFKVLPAAETVHTVVLVGNDPDSAVRAMTAALQSPFEVSGAAHLPAPVAAASKVSAIASAGNAVTLLRVEGFGPSVDYRCGRLRDLLTAYGESSILRTEESEALWREVRDVSFFAGSGSEQVWRLSLPPNAGARVSTEILEKKPGRAFLDWGGGLIWLALEPTEDAAHETVRAALSGCGGHATLIRADESVRATVPVFQPQPAHLAAVTARVKESFDPGRVLNPGRMYDGV